MASQPVRIFAEQAGRPVVMGRRGAVSSGHPLASLAGLEILQRGGSAVDAAVAVAAALNVVEPHMSGLGGDLFALVYEAGTGRVYAVNGTGPAPRTATLDRFAQGIPERGPLSASVPGALSGWIAMLEHWGRLDLASVLGPAIRLAAEGFPVSHNLSAYLQAYRPLLSQFDTSARIFLPGGEVPRPGQVLIQRDLARTFELLARDGHEAFYRGPVGREIARACTAAGGLLDEGSLIAFRAEVVEPLSVSYRGHQVFAPPPNSSAHVLLQELLMFSCFEPAHYRPLTAELIHLMVEIKKLAFADREAYNGDPRFAGPLPEFLLSPEYAHRRVALIDPERARAEVMAGTEQDGDTTYFAVADREGNVVSVTASINMAFGSGFVAGSTGILLNNRMTYWHLDPGHPNALEPGKRVRHTISPALVLGDEWALAIGTPGSDGQVQTIFQVLVHVLDYGFPLQPAIELPRWRSFARGHESNWPHGERDELQVEGRMPNQTIEGLQARGHRVVRLGKWGPIGSCQAVLVDRAAGVFQAAADPRSDAYALAW